MTILQESSGGREEVLLLQKLHRLVQGIPRVYAQPGGRLSGMKVFSFQKTIIPASAALRPVDAD